MPEHRQEWPIDIGSLLCQYRAVLAETPTSTLPRARSAEYMRARKRQIRIRGLFPLCLLLGPSLAAAEDVTAIKANDFLNSIAVCTHMSQGEDDPAKVRECLAYTGIRAIREDGTSNKGTLQAYLNLHKTTGVRFVLLPHNGNIAASLAQYETLAAEGALLAAEGPNEPNNWHVTYKGATSSNRTSLPIALFQKDLYAAVKADPKLAGIPVFHSSEAGGSEPDNCGLQYLTIPEGVGTLLPAGTKFADFANVHNYVCGHGAKPTEDNVAWNAEDATLNGKWDGLWVEYGHTWWGQGFNGYTKAQLEKLPRVTTETGWTTRLGADDKGSSVSEEQQGRIFLNLYLDAVKRGWSYTFIYMLHDSKGQGAWGFVRNDYSNKPSANYLHNMTTILSDKSSAFTPGKVIYSIANQPATVHDLLLQKSNGSFQLAVWGELGQGSTDVVVNLGASYKSVKIYDPTVGTDPVKSATDASAVPLTLSDHPFIIDIGPSDR